MKADYSKHPDGRVCKRCGRTMRYRQRWKNSRNGKKYLFNAYDCPPCYSNSPKGKATRKRKRQRRRWEKLRERQAKLNGKSAPETTKPSIHQRIALGERMLFHWSVGRPCSKCGSLGSKYPKSSWCKKCGAAASRERTARRAIEDPAWYAAKLEQFHAMKATYKGGTKRRRVMDGDDLTSDQWQAILREFDYTCIYCDKRGGDLERDHIIPHSKGGFLTMDNVVPACGLCNNDRSTADFRDYINDEQKYDAVLQTLGDLQYI